MKPLTEFQQKIKACILARPNGHASTWEIAQIAFPEKWGKRSGRGALIGHIDRQGRKINGVVRLPPRNRFDEAILCLSQEADAHKSGRKS